MNDVNTLINIQLYYDREDYIYINGILCGQEGTSKSVKGIKKFKFSNDLLDPPVTISNSLSVNMMRK